MTRFPQRLNTMVNDRSAHAGGTGLSAGGCRKSQLQALRKRILPFLAATALAGVASPALAGKVVVFTRAETVTESGAGQVSASVVHGAFERGVGAAYEYTGGVGVAGATMSDSTQGGDFIPQVLSQAQFADNFRVGQGDGVGQGFGNLGSGLYRLTVAISVGGSVEVGQSPAPSNGVPMSAQASYNWDYTIGGRRREGGMDLRTFEGRTTTVESGLGGNGVFREVILVRLDDVIGLALNAGSFSSASAHGGGTARSEVDFGHTLRWAGVEGIQYDTGGGNFVDAPDGFRLTLNSTSNNFDYWNDAGPNPFTSGAVPEPGAWALMIGGFGMAGAMLRRRRTVAA